MATGLENLRIYSFMPNDPNAPETKKPKTINQMAVGC